MRKTWHVMKARKDPWETVEADYFTLEHGHLVFKNNTRPGYYPEAIRVFAPGAWMEVKNG